MCSPIASGHFPILHRQATATCCPEVLAARQRGVFFDVGHGMGSFSFKVARIMLENGFYPDTILSDYPRPLYQWPGLRPGDDFVQIPPSGECPFSEVIRASTQNAALASSPAGPRQFKAGAVGDAAILSLDEGGLSMSIRWARSSRVSGKSMSAAWFSLESGGIPL